MYSREAALDNSHIMHTQKLPAPIVLIAPSGEDSLLVYTYENILYHYVISVSDASVKLVQVGQIALHGIIRAPTRVRALSWILPEDQIRKCSKSVTTNLLTTYRQRRSITRCRCRNYPVPSGWQTRASPTDDNREWRPQVRNAHHRAECRDVCAHARPPCFRIGSACRFVTGESVHGTDDGRGTRPRSP